MNKPVSVAIAECKRNIENVLQASGLPPIILEPIMQAYAAAITRMAAEQTINESKEWEISQKQTKEGE